MATVVIFFFQAEDGIRDYKVTGVQTCALPIFPSPSPPFLVLRESKQACFQSTGFYKYISPQIQNPKQAIMRSEERRVGKSVDLGGRRIIKKKKEKESRMLCLS